MRMQETGYPARQGLYDPALEHDSCGFGFVADIKGRPSHDIVAKALEVLLNLEHRGATGAEKDTGDGAGILLQTPHAFLAKECWKLGLELPARGRYGVGMVFLPPSEHGREAIDRLFQETIRGEGQQLLGWRDVPTDNAALGATAKASQPVIRQIFIGRGPDLADDAAFERKLYVIRRLVEKKVSRSAIPGRSYFYVPSLSHKTVVYKGMLNASQLRRFYVDLQDAAVVSAIGMVHSRFSTNTFPSWGRAHPYRYISHNGEINTLRGNINWMHARQSMMSSRLFGKDLLKVLTVIDTEGSDSAMFDNVLELLTLSGRELPHAIMMMVPEPWSKDETMSAERKAFYEFHSCLMEPWDGPASIAFTDGIRVGAVLDRNGLRPSRYYVTKDDLVVMSSEVGVLDIPADRVLEKGRLQPGRLFLVDTAEQRIVADEDLKERIARQAPYGEWLRTSMLRIEDLPASVRPIHPDHEVLLRRQEVFGYTSEDVKLLMSPMAGTANEAVGSMGTDTPLAVLSERPQLLFNYFQQLFAQVTNPPVDAIREEIIMASETSVGPEGNLLDPGPECCRQLALPAPIITNDELAKIRALDGGPGTNGLKAVKLPTLFDPKGDGAALRRALEDLRWKASECIAEGFNLLVLSDRGHDAGWAPIPSLLAVAAVHHHLIREGTRTRCSLIVESGEPREVHHFALLMGYGASAVNPYLAFEAVHDLVKQGLMPGPAAEAEKKYLKAVVKGLVKVISKMGISTIQSYHGAQVFETIGLSQDFVDEYFTWTASRVGGVGIDVVAKEARMRHERGFPPKRPIVHTSLPAGGEYQYRAGGEFHLTNPETIHKLQYACRTGDYKVFQEYTALIDDQSRQLCTLRGLMDFRAAAKPVRLDEVEPVESILRRFKSGAMSYGSISKEAHETLAIAMNRIGGKSNTGEGGEDPARYVKEPNGDSKNSGIKQVASGRFGVTSYYLVNARELQIKIAQGAKPGEGGQLPGNKVYPWIAKVRHATPGVGLISPPPHHDIYSIEDLKELIHDLKNANKDARISVKLVAELGVGTIAAGVAKAHADVVLISGHDGGTGASPLTSIKHAGIPWELGLAETHQVLVLNDLRSRITVEVDGQLKTGRDVVIGALLGAEEFGFATAPLVALGCIMMRACHLNTCPVGIATQDPRLRAKFAGKPEHVVNFMRFIAQEVREYAPRGRSLEGAQPGLQPHPLQAHRSQALRADPPDPAGPRPGQDARRQHPARAGQAGAGGAQAGAGDAADPQHQPRGGHHDRKRADPALRAAGPARGHHPLPLQGIGGAVVRGFHPSRHDPGARRRFERLHRQRPERRAHRGLPAQGGDLPGGGERHRRQRRFLWRHLRRGVHPRRGRRALLRAQFGHRRGGGRSRRPRLRVHDRRAGGGAGADGAQLRGRHVGRRRVRAGRRRPVRQPLQQADGRAGACDGRGGRGGEADGGAARRADRQRAGAAAARAVGRHGRPAGPGDAERLPAHAGRAGQDAGQGAFPRRGGDGRFRGERARRSARQR